MGRERDEARREWYTANIRKGQETEVPMRPKKVFQGHERVETDRRIRGCGQKGEFQSSGFQKQSNSS